jgi:hypothetical protein
VRSADVSGPILRLDTWSIDGRMLIMDSAVTTLNASGGLPVMATRYGEDRLVQASAPVGVVRTLGLLQERGQSIIVAVAAIDVDALAEIRPVVAEQLWKGGAIVANAHVIDGTFYHGEDGLTIDGPWRVASLNIDGLAPAFIGMGLRRAHEPRVQG